MLISPRIVFCLICVLGMHALTAVAQPTTVSPAVSVVPYPAPPSELPGKGLAEHDFLYCGQADNRKSEATLFLVRAGSVAWTYQVPIIDETNGQSSELSDMHRLSNGDIVIAYKTGWRKIDSHGKTLYDYKCPKITGDDGQDVLDERGRPLWSECHSAQPVAQDKVLFMQNGRPAKLIIYNLVTATIEHEQIMHTQPVTTARSVHNQFRNVRLTPAGTYLIAHMDLNKVIEYDKDGNTLWSCDAPNVWHAARLANGHTLVSGNQHGYVREFDAQGKIVWELTRDDLPGIKINGIHQAIRRANGNTVFCNWTTRVNKADWPKIVQVIEVTQDKKVVWALNEWTDPDLGPASCIQLLNEPGRAEAQELMR
jgi:hypothetical protein